MTRRRIFIVLGMFSAPWLEIAACSNGTTFTDAGPDAARDSTVDTSHPDAGSEGAKEAGVDASGDAASDVAMADVSEAGDAKAGDAEAGADAGSSWHTITTCDGVIGVGEYGTSSNQTTSATQTWYMTWDSTNLYVAVSNAALTEADVIYVGFSGKGITTGQIYDGTGGTLPFKADGVLYAKSGYQETRIALEDAGAWGSASTGTLTYCDSGDASATAREEIIPWTALGGTGLPSSFRFLAYLTSSGGFVYGQIPTTNAGGTIGTSYTFPHDFYVASTANGTGSFPFDIVE